jgi:hypothetical protein
MPNPMARLDSPDNPADMGPDALAEYAKQFVDSFRDGSRAAGLTQRRRSNWMKYYARDDNHAGWSDDLYPEGEQGEKVRMRVNVARNLILHILSMTTGVRPTIDPKALNTDLKSIKQTEIARAVADHYLKTVKVYRYVDDATEMGLALGEGYIHGGWDETAGEFYAAPPASPEPAAQPAGMGLPPQANQPAGSPLDMVMAGNPAAAQPMAPPGAPPAQGQQQLLPKGDVCFNVLSGLDVAHDLRLSSPRDMKECVVREWFDRFDVAAKYPKLADKIMTAPARGQAMTTVIDNELPTPGRTLSQTMPSNLIEVFTYYHAKSAGSPQGRKLVFLADCNWLEDGPLPFAKIPLFRISPSDVMGTAFGFAPLTELAPLQEALDKAMSSVATRIFAHGVANIVVKRGSAPEASQLTGGLNMIEVDSLSPGDKPVELLELLSIPPELTGFVEIVTKMMEATSGVNAVVRGNPPPGLDAGVAIAQFQAMAVQFASRLEQSYVECIEDLVLFIFDALRTHSETMPRVVQLVGRSKRESLQEFYGSDLSGICRVVADMGNPLSRTAAGKAMIADYLRNSGIPVTPEQFVQVLNSGNIDTMTESITTEMNLIRQENEMLADGQPVAAVRGENHALHIREHRAIINNPEIKFNPQLMALVDEHMQMHEQMWMMGDPLLGIAMGMIPMGAGMMGPPPNGPPGGPGADAQRPPSPPPGHGAPPGGPPMHAPPPKGAGPGALPRVMQPPPIPGMPVK